MADYIGSDSEYDNYSSWMNYFIYPDEKKTIQAMRVFQKQM